MICNLGTDILRIERIAACLARHGPRFAQKILHPIEIEEFTRRRHANEARGIRYLAARFCAKEALYKALASQIEPCLLTWQSIAIRNDASGKPYLEYGSALEDSLRQQRLRVHISLSDEKEYVFASVVVEAAAE